MKNIEQLQIERNEILCGMLRREFDETKNKRTARKVVELAFYCDVPQGFYDDLLNDFESVYKINYMTRTLGHIEAHNDEGIGWNFDKQEDGNWHVWPDTFGETYAEMMREVGWCYIVPKEVFIDNDSIDTAADLHDHSAVKYHDPRTMVGVGQRLYAHRGLIDIETF